MIDTGELALRLRRHVVSMCSRGGSSHVGSGLSIADIIAVLYGGVLRVDPARPDWNGRDRFVLSKGHAGACVYAALAERGFFDSSVLETHYSNGSNLSGHVSHKGVPGVEVSTGSLGHGLGIGTGMAFNLKRMGGKQRVFVVLGDGECDEGSVWEAALFAGHQNLENLCVIIDYNKLQSIGRVSDTLNLEPFAAKWRAFGWRVSRVDGHDHDDLRSAFSELSANCPTCVIADTVKGRGVSFMENEVLWHYRVPKGDEYIAAMLELGVDVALPANA
ncbi:MAG TPA: transketolase [Sphingomicrobium sp.]|jgi:transketolase|nr:transketolase [Sphingomicrobium sp.]